jgi:hypothetical protein
MSGDLDSLLQVFLRERKYLHNLRPQTIEWYETAWKAFRKSATHCLTDSAALNRSHLEQFIYSLVTRPGYELSASASPRSASSPSSPGPLTQP